jgi:hypothetical protein
MMLLNMRSAMHSAISKGKSHASYKDVLGVTHDVEITAATDDGFTCVTNLGRSRVRFVPFTAVVWIEWIA